MTLQSLVDEHASRSVTLTVYGDEPVPEVESIFESPQVRVDFIEFPELGGGGFVSVEDETGFLGTVPLDAAESLLAPRAIPDPGFGALDRSGVGTLLELTREVTFTSFDRRQLLLTAREFEDRAWRSTGGELHAGFQRPDALAAQQTVYRDLASHPGLDVHVYAEPDWDLPDLPGVILHEIDAPDLTDVWFVVFDGGDVPADACALLAVELEPGEYYGYWTYDMDAVETVLDMLADDYT